MKINYNLVIVKKITDDMYESIKNYTKVNKSKLGCVLSHLYCIKKGINSGSDKFIIFEDDIIFHKNFNTVFTEDILNLNFDMIMLGACDFNYKYNKQFVKLISDDLTFYKPFKIALGAHANLYSINFAKKVYEYKVSNTIAEFDTDFKQFYGRNSNIYVCNPNLVITELSTSNLEHNFGSATNIVRHIKTIFDESFTYKDYNYITIDFINYIKNVKDDTNYKHLVEVYMTKFNINVEYKNMIYESLLNSNYTLEDIKTI